MVNNKKEVTFLMADCQLLFQNNTKSNDTVENCLVKFIGFPVMRSENYLPECLIFNNPWIYKNITFLT